MLDTVLGTGHAVVSETDELTANTFGTNDGGWWGRRAGERSWVIKESQSFEGTFEHSGFSHGCDGCWVHRDGFSPGFAPRGFFPIPVPICAQSTSPSWKFGLEAKGENA